MFPNNIVKIQKILTKELVENWLQCTNPAGFCKSSWGPGMAAFCDCGTPWTFLLPSIVISPLFHNILLPVVRFSCFNRDHIFTSRYVVI